MANTGVVRNVSRLGFPWITADPFLFCAHHDDAYPKGNEDMGPAVSLEGRDMGQDFAGKDGWRMYHGDVVPGFPQHPHRGFETVTIVRNGLIDHSDSLGATARFGAGDVQWLTAGKGVVHAEMFPLVARDAENPLELFQIWLNLPRANKMVEPHFSMLWSGKVPKRSVRDSENRATEVTVIAGSLDGIAALPPPPKSWASNPDSDLAIWTFKMEPHAEWTMPAAKPGTNRTLYVFRGAGAEIAGTTVPGVCAVEMRPDAEVPIKNGDAPGDFLLLQGRPIGEPVAHHGPFVMNSVEELRQAFADFQRTQFGGWPWDSSGPVHAREEGIFAKHPDGRVERPSK